MHEVEYKGFDVYFSKLTDPRFPGKSYTHLLRLCLWCCVVASVERRVGVILYYSAKRESIY